MAEEDDELAGAGKGNVRACPNCGSRDLKWVGGGASAVFDYVGTTSLGGWLHCENCGKTVLPIYFDSEEARRKFEESLKKEGTGK